MGMAAESQFHVLAVDDSIIDRKLIERLLKTSSYQVTTVDSGSKALKFLGLHEDGATNPNTSSVSPNNHQEVEVNLVITDYCMPGMTGYDLLKKIKESSSLKNIPVVIMSSENVPSRISRCLEEGAEEFFLKPVRLSDLNKLGPHMLKTKFKDHNQKREKQEEKAAFQSPKRQEQEEQHQHQQQLLQQQSNNNKRKDIEEGLSPERTRPSILLCLERGVKEMSTGAVRRVSRQDIQLVQNLIERCLQLYMTQKEVVETLLAQATIEPGFTELVWQKLEEENREFFEAYYLRLMVKQQIMEFNKLLEQQVQLMHQIHPTGVSSIPNSNGPHMPPMPQNSSCYAPENTGQALKQENMHHPMGYSLPNVFTNGSLSLHAGMHSPIELPTHASRIEVPPAMLSTQSSNMGLMQGINGKMIKSEAGYSGSSADMFGAESNVLEARPTIGDTSFSTVESSTQPLNEPLLDADISSFGFLGQIPRSFSLSDLTADFSQCSGLSLSVSCVGICMFPMPHLFV